MPDCGCGWDPGKSCCGKCKCCAQNGGTGISKQIYILGCGPFLWAILLAVLAGIAGMIGGSQ